MIKQTLTRLSQTPTTRLIRAMSTYKYVVLGGGNAAGYAAREFVAQNVAPGDLCIVGEEPVLPYERPALSKAVLVKKQVRLPGFNTCVGSGGERYTQEWYDEHGIETKLGQPVVAVDTASRSLTLADGAVVSASEALILATGAAPIKLTRTEGHHLNGIHYLRDNDDAMKLYDALQANVGKTVIVVGGGYIGMEVTAAAITVGCRVKMIFPEENVMPRLFTPELARYYERVYEEKGVELLNNGRLCKAFLDDGAGQLRGVKMCQNGLGDAEVEGTLVVVGVGARTNVALFKDAVEMDARGGVVVDGNLKTSVDGVYAIGDIATFPLKLYNDRPVRMEHVQNARDSASHVAKVVMKKTEEAYDYVPYFYSRVFDLSWQFFGDNVGDCLIAGDFNPKLLAIWVQGSDVHGIFMEHPSAEETAAMKKVAREGASVDVEAFKKAGSVEEAWALIQ